MATIEKPFIVGINRSLKPVGITGKFSVADGSFIEYDNRYVITEKLDGANTAIYMIDADTVSAVIKDYVASLKKLSPEALANHYKCSSKVLYEFLEYFDVPHNTYESGKVSEYMKKLMIILLDHKPKTGALYVTSKNFYLHPNRTNRGSLDYFFSIADKLTLDDKVVYAEWMVRHSIRYGIDPAYIVIGVVAKEGDKWYWQCRPEVEEVAASMGLGTVPEMRVPDSLSSLNRSVCKEGIVYVFNKKTEVNWNTERGLYSDESQLCVANTHVNWSGDIDVKYNLYEELKKHYMQDIDNNRMLDGDDADKRISSICGGAGAGVTETSKRIIRKIHDKYSSV